MYRKHLDLIIAIFSLVLGGFIYIFFRDEKIIIFYWVRYMNLDFSFFKQIAVSKNVILSYIIYSLPNGLWLLSGLLLINVIFKHNKRVLYMYSTVFILLAIIFEICQLLGIINGTFDIFDIFTILAFSYIGFAISNYGEYHEGT